MIDDQSASTNSINTKDEATGGKSTASSPAESFRRLEEVVWKVYDEVVGKGGHKRGEESAGVDDAEAYRLEGKLSILEAFFQVHSLLFKRVLSMEAGEWAPDPFIIDLLKHIENELERQEVYVVRPEPGAALDLRYMHTQRDIPARFWRKSNTVAKVHSCGFTAKIDGAEKVLKMAVVDVYRKKADAAEEK